MKKEYAVNRSNADDEETVTDFTSPVGLKTFHFSLESSHFLQTCRVYNSRKSLTLISPAALILGKNLQIFTWCGSSRPSASISVTSQWMSVLSIMPSPSYNASWLSPSRLSLMRRWETARNGALNLFALLCPE